MSVPNYWRWFSRVTEIAFRNQFEQSGPDSKTAMLSAACSADRTVGVIVEAGARQCEQTMY